MKANCEGAYRQYVTEHVWFQRRHYPNLYKFKQREEVGFVVGAYDSFANDFLHGLIKCRFFRPFVTTLGHLCFQGLKTFVLFFFRPGGNEKDIYDDFSEGMGFFRHICESIKYSLRIEWMSINYMELI